MLVDISDVRQSGIIEIAPPPYEPTEDDARWYRRYHVEEESRDFVSGIKEQVKAAPSQWAEFAIKIPLGDKLTEFSFKERRYLRAIYDTAARRVLLKCGRQVEKSTSVGNRILSYCGLSPFFRALYVSPSHTQTKTFSRDRIKEPIDLSPEFKSLTNSKLLSNVLEKKFITGSQITMRFAFLNADRVRGIPADLITIDEFQDILLDNVPVIEECASHSLFKLFFYSGTPKSLDGSLETYWTKFSTQNEWVVPCRAHGTPKDPSSWHWNILNEENIGRKSLICDRCGGPIEPMDDDSQWASLNPHPRVEKPFEGYRIPQLMVPWMGWDDILHKQRTYSRAKFYNEVLGLSYDSGTRPLTRQDLIDNSWGELSMRHYEEVAKKYSAQYPVFMGIDWGCHDDKTRILTEEGFKYFRDVTPSDKVAQFNEHTRRMSFVRPEKLTVRDWDGYLHHFKNDSLDMMLTHTHRMLVRGKSGSWHVESAGEVAERKGHVEFVGKVEWEGQEQNTLYTSGPKGAPVTYNMNDYLGILGCRLHNVDGEFSGEKRIPRWVFSLSKRQLQVLFDAMMWGDGSVDKEGDNSNGTYTSTSRGLCEDFQELCIRLGLRASVALYEPAEGTRYRVSWSEEGDYTYNYPSEKTEKVPYNGKVYCCKVPDGMIVTERNGKIAFQGNTGENSYTVVTLSAYLPVAPERFTFFYMHRFEGIESEPKVQLRKIIQLVEQFNVMFVGVDYGGGFWPNDELVRYFGAEKIKKYQWVGNVKKKVVFEPRLGVPRYLCHRTEVMSDVFNAIKRRNVFLFPRWEEFEDPYAADFLNVFSEYNERLRMNVYKHTQGCPDDTCHSVIFNFLASFHYRQREDVIIPSKEVDRVLGEGSEREEWDITSYPYRD